MRAVCSQVAVCVCACVCVRVYVCVWTVLRTLGVCAERVSQSDGQSWRHDVCAVHSYYLTVVPHLFLRMCMRVCVCVCVHRCVLSVTEDEVSKLLCPRSLAPLVCYAEKWLL